MTENIQPRILIVNNIYIKDHVDNDTHGRYNCCAISRKISVTEIKLGFFFITNGRAEHNTVAELELTKNDLDVIQQGPDQNNLTANIKGQMDALKINSQRIFDFGQRCAKSSPEPATTTTETSATSFTSNQIE